MKTVFSERNLLIIMGIALACIYWNHKKNQEARLGGTINSVVQSNHELLEQNKPISRKIAATPTPTPRDLNPPLVTSTPALKTTTAGASDQIDLCRNFSSFKFLVHEKLLKPILTQVNAAVAVPDELQTCLNERTNVLVLNFAGFDYKYPQPYYYSTLEPRAFISNIEKDLSLNKILSDSEKLRKLGFASEATASKFYADVFGPDSLKKNWSFIPLSISDKSLGSATFFPPENHPFAKTVKKENINRLISLGAAVLDVRPQKNFKQSHIDKAISNPTKIKKVADSPLSVEEQKKAGYVIHPVILPTDKSTAILVVNQNPKSYSAYNTITQLAGMGYTNLHLYWGGMDDWDGQSIIPPEKIEGARYITYHELLARFSSTDALVIDVRNGKNAKKKVLPRNINMPFSEKKNPFKDPLYRINGLSASAIQQHEERFLVGMPELPPNIKTLVLMGDHSLDWKPLKAALVIPHGASIKVEIYRDGYKGWKYLSRLESPLPKRLGDAKKDFPRTTINSQRSFSSSNGILQQNPISNPLAKNDLAAKDPKVTNDNEGTKTKSKSSKPKTQRTTRSDGSSYQRLNAPSPVKPK